MINQTAAAMSEALVKGEVTSTQLTQAHLDRISDVDTSVKAFLHVDEEGALEKPPASMPIAALERSCIHSLEFH